MLVNFEIQQTTLLARVSKVAIRSPKSLRRLRQVLYLCLLEATTLPFDPQNSLIGTERRKGAFCKYWCMERFAYPRKISSGHKGDYWQFFSGFQFSQSFSTPSRHTFTGEEVVLLGFYHICMLCINFNNELIRIRFGYSAPVASFCFKSFLGFMAMGVSARFQITLIIRCPCCLILQSPCKWNTETLEFSFQRISTYLWS